MNEIELLKEAVEARNASYSPYSNYAVGAAIRCTNGEIIHGCNVENSSYPNGSCAETIAFNKAVSDGKWAFDSIAIVGASTNLKSIDEAGDICFPCGLCRQVIREFVNPATFIVIVAPLNNLMNFKTFTLEELLPNSFGPEALEVK
ncbi:MAG: cytidine deaminase [Bifidobacteriaceae bacterium]|jgi:cytidine deaminase|nr:cytidine deaminase [Bifidobacteriaceae bacterium]